MLNICETPVLKCKVNIGSMYSHECRFSHLGTCNLKCKLSGCNISIYVHYNVGSAVVENGFYSVSSMAVALLLWSTSSVLGMCAPGYKFKNCGNPTSDHFLVVAECVLHLQSQYLWLSWTQVQSLCWEDPLEKEIAIHSSSLAWRIPWMEEPGRLQFTGLTE